MPASFHVPEVRVNLNGTQPSPCVWQVQVCASVGLRIWGLGGVGWGEGIQTQEFQGGSEFLRWKVMGFCGFSSASGSRV